MALWRLSYRTGRSVDIEADEVRREGVSLVWRRYEVLVCAPREVVVLRVLASDVEQVERVG